MSCGRQPHVAKQTAHSLNAHKTDEELNKAFPEILEE